LFILFIGGTVDWIFPVAVAARGRRAPSMRSWSSAPNKKQYSMEPDAQSSGQFDSESNASNNLTHEHLAK